MPQNPEPNECAIGEIVFHATFAEGATMSIGGVTVAFDAGQPSQDFYDHGPFSDIDWVVDLEQSAYRVQVLMPPGEPIIPDPLHGVISERDTGTVRWEEDASTGETRWTCMIRSVRTKKATSGRSRISTS